MGLVAESCKKNITNTSINSLFNPYWGNSCGQFCCH